MESTSVKEFHLSPQAKLMTNETGELHGRIFACKLCIQQVRFNLDRILGKSLLFDFTDNAKNILFDLDLKQKKIEQYIANTRSFSEKTLELINKVQRSLWEILDEKNTKIDRSPLKAGLFEFSLSDEFSKELDLVLTFVTPSSPTQEAFSSQFLSSLPSTNHLVESSRFMMRSFFVGKQIDAAFEVFKNMSESKRTPQDYLLWAEYFFDRGEFSHALVYAEYAFKIAPESIEVLEWLAKICKVQHLETKYQKTLERLIVLKPHCIVFWDKLMESYLESDEIEKARSFLLTCENNPETKDPKNAIVFGSFLIRYCLKTKELERADQIADSFAKKMPEDQEYKKKLEFSYFVRAQVYFIRNQLGLAKTYIDLIKNPNYEHLDFLVKLNIKLENYLFAQHYALKAIAKDPLAISQNLNLAVIYLKLGQKQQAQQLLIKIIEQAPTWEEPKLYLRSFAS